MFSFPEKLVEIFHGFLLVLLERGNWHRISESTVLSVCCSSSVDLNDEGIKNTYELSPGGAANP